MNLIEQLGEFEQGRDTSELRQEFESFLIATCADYKYWLKRYVYFNGHLYSPVNYRDSCHCAKASKISTALLVWNHQQSKIEQLEKRISDALKVLNDASPTMLDKKAIRILRDTT